MITVTMHKWGDRYTAEHVNRLASAFTRHCRLPHRFVCITDDPSGIDEDIETRPIGPEIGYNWHPARPNCYRRLWLFSDEAGEELGERILSIDLDTVITGDLTPLLDRPEEFIIVRGRKPMTPYVGCMWLLSAGSRRQVWDELDPQTFPERAKREGRVGSDQSAIAMILGHGEATWGRDDWGVYGYGVDILRGNGGHLPRGARMVCFWGPHDPAKSNKDWVKEHWR